ncbi:MAG: sigma 54-interacting transcriptional regulator [Verrucomicrobiota bacterium]
MTGPRILIIEDEQALGLALAAVVRQAGAEAVLAPTAAQARRRIKESPSPFTALLLDIGLPDENGLHFLEQLPRALRPPTLVISAHGELDNTIEARKLGVLHFLPKPLDFAELKASLCQLLEPAPSPKHSQRQTPWPTYLGSAPSMRPVFQQIAHACSSEEPVLISGRTGTGKSLTAHLIHRHTSREQALPTILYPSSADPESQLQEAIASTKGGALLLEQIDQLDPNAQSQLIHRWESDGDSFPRILATCDSDLLAQVNAGEFRSDLYYRLHVLEISLPDLSERIADLPPLFAFFLAEAQPDRTLSIGSRAFTLLEKHAWPGNLRELRSVASHALTVCGEGKQIEPEHLPRYLRTDSTAIEARTEEKDLETALDHWLDHFDPLPPYRDLAAPLERMLLERLLPRFDGKLSRLASELEANRTTLRNRLRR